MTNPEFYNTLLAQAKNSSKMESKMNPQTKRTPWVAMLLILAASAFGDDDVCRPPQRKSFEQAKKLTKTQMSPAYNAPARIEVRGSWDLYLTGSFIFWQLSQDNMEIAFADGLTNTAYIDANQIKGNLVPMSFDYKPGFKVALGINTDQDDWDALAEYTRIHASNSASTNGQTAIGTGTQLPLLPTWGHPYVMESNAYDTASEKWNTNFDFIDIDLGRVYYVGTQLTFHPFFGARGAFITQNVHVHYVNSIFSPGSASFPETLGVMDIYKRLQSWAIGPRVGVNTNWMMGLGMRFFGNATADVLYTKHKIQDKTTFVATTTGLNEFFVSRDRPLNLRTHLDLEMGLGWGSYFDNNNWHIDLSAAYGFQVFFDQNMFSDYLNNGMPGHFIAPQGNLYAQGLTATVRFDF